MASPATSRLTVSPSDDIRLTEGHHATLRAMDGFFGSFCVASVLVAVFSWWHHQAGLRDPAIVLLFLLANVVVSSVSLRARNPYYVEVLRAVVGAIIAPAAYLLVKGPLAPWWPGYLIMCLGGCIILGIITQRPLWGRLLVVYYLSMFTVATLLGREHVDWYQFFVDAGVIAMVGLMFAQIMSLFGQTLRTERERTIELQVARDALFAEVEVAQEIQKLLLPEKPTVPNTSISGRMLPAAEVGGDYYDVVSVATPRGDRHFLAVGDVSGHGLTSGLTMMMARSSLLGALAAESEADVTAVYRALNRGVRANLGRMQVQMYMTFLLVEAAGNGAFRAVGRHLPLLVHRKATGAVEEIEVEGVWLGILDELPKEFLRATDFTLAPGDVLLLYTDGVLERTGEDGMFGIERLRKAFADAATTCATTGATIDAILAELDRFGAERDDDVTLLAVEYRG